MAEPKPQPKPKSRPKNNSKTRPNYDSPWKEALTLYFPSFLQLLAPALYDQVDWSHPVSFLDKEFQAISRLSADGKRYVDKLVQVRSKDAIFFWIVVHVEIQGDQVTPVSLKHFSERMYQYNYRIRDHCGRTMVLPDQDPQRIGLISLGVLTTGKGTVTELIYQHDVLGLCRTQFHFPVVYLAKWLDRWDELKRLAATNPFAVLVMAQLQAQEAGKNERQKLVSKTQIMRLLFAYQYTAKDVNQLFRLVDWIIATPPELDAELTRVMNTIEQEQNMTYVTSIEREGIRKGLSKGLSEGLVKGEANLLERLLTRKFGPLPEELQRRLKDATLAQLETWSLNILDANNLDDVFTD